MIDFIIPNLIFKYLFLCFLLFNCKFSNVLSLRVWSFPPEMLSNKHLLGEYREIITILWTIKNYTDCLKKRNLTHWTGQDIYLNRKLLYEWYRQDNNKPAGSQNGWYATNICIWMFIDRVGYLKHRLNFLADEAKVRGYKFNSHLDFPFDSIPKPYIDNIFTINNYLFNPAKDKNDMLRKLNIYDAPSIPGRFNYVSPKGIRMPLNYLTIFKYHFINLESSNIYKDLKLKLIEKELTTKPLPSRTQYLEFLLQNQELIKYTPIYPEDEYYTKVNIQFINLGKFYANFLVKS